MKQPIFLIGAERSGTTVLRLMLDSHPLISWLKEFEYSVDLMTNKGAYPDIDSYHAYLSTNRIFLSTGLTVDSQLDYPQLINSFLRQKLNCTNKLYVGATCHRHYDRLLTLYPEARFIYLYRDPRDVAKSNIGMGWAGNCWHGVDRWLEAEHLWDHLKDRITKQSYIEIKYEDLIVDPKHTLSKICDFIGIDYDHNMLRYPDTTTYSAPDTNLINQWKKTLTNKEIQQVEFKAAHYMKNRNYAFSSSNLKRPTAAELLYLPIQNKLFKIFKRINSFGFFIVFAEFLTRKLRLLNSHRKIVLIINKKTEAFLK